MKRTGAEIIVSLLERQGITIAAGIPGGANLPLYDALSNSSIKHVLTRHEQGAGFFAQGAARTTGKPAVCFATSGPGAVNLLTAVADAKLDSVPIVCITGQVPSSMLGTDAFQEVDTYGLSIPITKHNYLARSPEELLDIIPEAFRIAASDRPGPVLIDVPKDVQVGCAEFDAWPEPAGVDSLPAMDPDDLDRAAAMIDKAQRPVLYIGGGVARSLDPHAALRLAERASVPTTMTLMGLGCIPSAHPLSMGMLGMHGAPYTNIVLEQCDLLIAAGVRFDDRATGKVERFCPDADIIHIDIDPGELGKIKNAGLGIIGDAGEVLAGIAERVQPRPKHPRIEALQKLKASHPMDFPEADDPLSPYGLIRKTAECLSKDAIIVTDVGRHQMWAAQAYPHAMPGRFLTSGGLGTMGFGLPTALGAKAAAPDTEVVLFSGDGSIMMNVQEFATMAEQGLGVKVVLMNNHSLGLVRQQQELFYNANYFASGFSIDVDFIGLARAMGVPGFAPADMDDPAAGLRDALQMPGPALIHVPVHKDASVWPIVPPGAANTEMISQDSKYAA